MSVRKHNNDLNRVDPARDGARRCDWPGCQELGEHRAPRSRQELKSYHWFCLEHVRVYNKSWNYYEGMNEDEVEADRREDTVWHRQSWPLGNIDLAAAFTPRDFCDSLGPLNGGASEDRMEKRPARRVPMSEEEKALVILDLLPPVTTAAVKARYKELVKRYHPDANGGDISFEEKFKQISQAYRTIMASLGV